MEYLSKIAPGLLLMIIFLFCGFGFIINLLMLVYPVLKIRIILKNNFKADTNQYMNFFLTKSGIEIVNDQIFWLKHLCIFSIWILIESILPFAFFFGFISVCLKSLVLSYCIWKHSIDSDKAFHEIYDRIDQFFYVSNSNNT